jgi:hypothetical protein
MKLRTPLAISAAILAAASSLAVVSVRRGVERDWVAMLARIDELEAERLARPTERDALYGDSTSDAAWPYYERALEELRGIEDARDRGRVAPYAKTDEERAAREALLSDAEELFTHLRRGAHARAAERPLEWSDGMSMRIQRLVEVRLIAELSVARAIALIESGDDVRAVETLLDAHQFARDLCVSPVLIEEMIGVSELVPTAATDFLAGGGAARMSTEAKELWLNGLDALHASLPRQSWSFLGEVELVGREFVRAFPGTDEESWSRSLETSPGWRFGFSWRGAAADYVERATEIVRDVEAEMGRSPAEAIRRFTELERAAADDPNPLFEIAMPKFSSAARSRYWSRARLSFLRYALAVDLGRAPCEPFDPFGNGVQIEVTEDRIHVRAHDGSKRTHQPEVVLAR